MKLWKITHHHPRAIPGAGVYLLPNAEEPTEAEAVTALQLRFIADHGESIEIEFTGYQVAPFYTDLLEAAQELLAHLQETNYRDSQPIAATKLERATQNAATIQRRTVIVVGGGIVTDVFSTERAMDITILDAPDVKSLSSSLQSVDDAVCAGSAALYRLL
jgi:hypothetical protein